MDIPEGHPSGVDVKAFMQQVEPRIRYKLEQDILALNGVKFQLALKVQLRKDNQAGVRSTQTLCCATSRRPFSRLAKSMRI